MKIVQDGLTVTPGYARGKCRILNSEQDVNCVENGEIIILPYSHPMFAPALFKASAVVCENGGKLSHICIVAMEMGLPCLTGVKNITKILNTGEEIMVDSKEGAIYLYE